MLHGSVILNLYIHLYKGNYFVIVQTWYTQLPEKNMYLMQTFHCFSLHQYLLPAIVHIQHQPFLEHGDGPIVSTFKNALCLGDPLISD